MAITFRTGLGRALYHSEMDANFSSLFYSSSLHSNGSVLRLWFDNGTAADTWQEINLSGAGTSISIANNVNNNILTATGLPSGIQGESDFTFDPISRILGLTGRISMTTGPSKFNVFIGDSTGPVTPGVSVINNVLVGSGVGSNLTGGSNTALGAGALPTAIGSSNNVSIGTNTFQNLTSGNANTAIGNAAGATNTAGAGNVYIGNAAGKVSPGAEDNQLYIANTSGTPLISGNFSTGQIMIQGGIGGITASFKGDGSGLTGVGAFPYTGSAIIKGTLLITGSNDAGTQTLLVSGGIFTSGSTSKISGSFSGSFYGDGSNLTGVPASTWNGIRNPNAQITGSIRFTGSLDLSGSMTISGSSLRMTGSLFVSSGSHTISGSLTAATNIILHNPKQSSTGIGNGTLGFGQVGANVQENNTAIGAFAGYGATGAEITVLGSEAGRSSGGATVYVGYRAGRRQSGNSNVAIGVNTFSNTGTATNVVAIGANALLNNQLGGNDVAIGAYALSDTIYGGSNTAIGYEAGRNFNYGSANVFIGYRAGPASFTNMSSQLYIANTPGTPLISGNFSTGQIMIQGGTGGITGSFKGNGSGLTSLNPFPYVGAAVITGSLTITGSAGSVRQLIVSGGIITSGSTSTISGSFSGSFYGDGSNLTGIPGSTWNGIRNGNAQITGSLRVSGSIRAQSSISISQTGSLNSVPGVELIHFYDDSLADPMIMREFPYGAGGYTGLKMDYSATSVAGNGNPSRIGTFIGTWDDNGDYSYDGVDTSTGLSNNAPPGVYDPMYPAFWVEKDGSVIRLYAKRGGNDIQINAMITAFKRSIV